MRGKTLLTILLPLVFFVSIFQVDWSTNLLNPGGFSTVLKVISGLTELDFSYYFFLICLKSVWITISYSVAAMSIAIVIGIPLGILASGTIFQSQIAKLTSDFIVRPLLALLRAIHELVWAWIIAITLGFTAISGVLALAIPYGAILARIYADLLKDVSEHPLLSLRASGGSGWQILFYGRLPAASSGIINYTVYRFECCLRSSAVLSFIGLQGIGYQIGISLSDLLFGQVWMLMFYLIGLIIVVDLWGGKIRRSIL